VVPQKKQKYFLSHHYDPVSKHWNMEWKQPALPSKKFQMQLSARKVMLTGSGAPKTLSLNIIKKGEQ
jgi:hypothetical protein